MECTHISGGKVEVPLTQEHAGEWVVVMMNGWDCIFVGEIDRVRERERERERGG